MGFHAGTDGKEKFDKIDMSEGDIFFDLLALNTEAPSSVVMLTLTTDIMRKRSDNAIAYIFRFTCTGCRIGEYDYTEYDSFDTMADAMEKCDEYRGSPEECHARYVKFMDNYHKILLETI